MMGPHARNIDEERQFPTLGEVHNNALTRQEGGDHYKSMGIQPLEFCRANMTHSEYIAALRKDVLKYTFREKGSRITDWKKAKHYLQLMIEAEEEELNESSVPTTRGRTPEHSCRIRSGSSNICACS